MNKNFCLCGERVIFFGDPLIAVNPDLLGVFSFSKSKIFWARRKSVRLYRLVAKKNQRKKKRRRQFAQRMALFLIARAALQSIVVA
ncbi:MAG: hypothetical protein V1777_00415 [Candidatus Micrarchaeota archaeon]